MGVKKKRARSEGAGVWRPSARKINRWWYILGRPTSPAFDEEKKNQKNCSPSQLPGEARKAKKAKRSSSRRSRTPKSSKRSSSRVRARFRYFLSVCSKDACGRAQSLESFEILSPKKKKRIQRRAARRARTPKAPKRSNRRAAVRGFWNSRFVVLISYFLSAELAAAAPGLPRPRKAAPLAAPPGYWAWGSFF